MGGVHGSNRLGGNALTEAVVFGKRIGRVAADYTKRTARDFNDSSIRQLVKDSLEKHGFRQVGGINLKDVLQIRMELQRIMWKNVGILRSRENLVKVVDKLLELKEVNKRNADIHNSKVGRAYLENDNAILTAIAVTKSALLREESRGSHYRVDYPESLSIFQNTHIYARITDYNQEQVNVFALKNGAKVWRR